MRLLKLEPRRVSFDPRKTLEDLRVDLEDPWSDHLVLSEEHVGRIASSLHLGSKDSLAPFVGATVCLDQIDLSARIVHLQQGINLSHIHSQVDPKACLPLAAILSVLNSDCHDEAGINNLLFFSIDGKKLVYSVVYNPSDPSRPLVTEACADAISKSTKARVLLAR